MFDFAFVIFEFCKHLARVSCLDIACVCCGFGSLIRNGLMFVFSLGLRFSEIGVSV